MFRLIRKSIEPYAPAMLFEMHELGFETPFEQLMACLLSIRTRDEVSLEAAKRLFGLARTPEQMEKLTVDQLAMIIKPCTFFYQKARTLRRVTEKILQDFGGKTPCDFDGLTSLPGVGPKCANLVLGISCGKKRIGVDIHVHRITNRWGYISAKTPEKSMDELEKKLPQRYWVEINQLLVPFGKHICLGVRPKCTVCPVFKFCQQVGVRNFQ